MTKVTPRARITTTILAGFLCLSLAPLASADEETVIQIVDGTGDVHPLAVLAQLPADAQAVEHMELYDIANTYIALESTEDFTIRIGVKDIPDDWLLEPGAPGAGPIPPITTSEGDVFTWDDSYLNSKIVLAAYFMINGEAYRAEAVLAEVNLANLGDAPGANTRELFEDLIAQARQGLTDLSVTVDGLMPTALLADAKARVQKNITDAKAYLDSAEQTYEDNKDTLDNDDADKAMAEAFKQARKALDDANAIIDEQVTAAGVQEGLDTQFTNVDETLGDAEELADGLPWAQAGGSGSVPPDPDNLPEAPDVVLFHRFYLYGPGGQKTDLSGLVSGEGNFVQMRVMKSDVEGPAMGDVLTNFRSEASFKDKKMDFAPDAANADPLDDAQQTVTDAATGQVVRPTFGLDYTFLYDPPVAPDTRIRMAIVSGGSSQEILAGGQATYVMSIKNVGNVPLEGLFTLSAPAAGWTHELDEFEWSLAPDQSQSVRLTVAAVEGAAASTVSRVMATAEGGGTQSLDFTTTLPQSSDGGEGGGDDEDGGGKSDRRRGSPGPEAVAIFAGLVGLLAYLRRRRA